jgi:hypothetical protein
VKLEKAWKAMRLGVFSGEVAGAIPDELTLKHLPFILDSFVKFLDSEAKFLNVLSEDAGGAVGSCGKVDLADECSVHFLALGVVAGKFGCHKTSWLMKNCQRFG